MLGLRFLAYVDLLGTTYSASTLATGYGSYIAQPLLRKAVEGKENVLTESQAQKILEDSMRVLYYRDARSLNKVRDSFVSHPLGVWLTVRSIKLPPSRPTVPPSQTLANWTLIGRSLRGSGVMGRKRSDSTMMYHVQHNYNVVVHIELRSHQALGHCD